MFDLTRAGWGRAHVLGGRVEREEEAKKDQGGG